MWLEKHDFLKAEISTKLRQNESNQTKMNFKKQMQEPTDNNVMPVGVAALKKRTNFFCKKTVQIIFIFDLVSLTKGATRD